MIAKNDKAHKSLSEQLAVHSITRVYEAIVYNNFSEDEGTVSAPIGRDPKNRLRMTVTSLHSKEATTHYRVLERFGQFTHIEAILETRKDTPDTRAYGLYQTSFAWRLAVRTEENSFGIEGQMLHAKKLGLSIPRGKAYIEFESPLPAEFIKTLEKLRK